MKPDLKSVRLAVLVADGISRLPLSALVREIIAGGADMIQLREKNLSDSLLLERARICRDAARDRIFIVNDRPDIAALSDADGVHLGPDDITPRDARRILGPGKLIGSSAYSIDEVRAAGDSGADYLGVGAIFPTGTKVAPVAGLALVREAARAARIPFLAIGGITLENVASVVSAGASAVAVSHAVVASDDPRDATAAIRRALLSALTL